MLASHALQFMCPICQHTLQLHQASTCPSFTKLHPLSHPTHQCTRSPTFPSHPLAHPSGLLPPPSPPPPTHTHIQALTTPSGIASILPPPPSESLHLIPSLFPPSSCHTHSVTHPPTHPVSPTCPPPPPARIPSPPPPWLTTPSGIASILPLNDSSWRGFNSSC